MLTQKHILYLHILQDSLDSLSRFRGDIETALDTGINLKICFDTEWPVYFERSGNMRRKTHGNINIIQLASNVTDYTIILGLYNFKDNEHHLQAIGQKLRAIFSLKVYCFTSCNHKSNYTLLKKQYKQFHLPDSAYNLMDDVSIMAINR